jgi:formylglycine-generating enzyme
MIKNQIFLIIISMFVSIGTCISQVEKSPMVIIPGGEYNIGKDSETNADYSPVHKVVVDSFYIDVYEVTNAQYYKFCIDTDRKLPEFWGVEKYRSSLDYPDYPVIGVSKNDAVAYAEHLGKRLPTEAEWEIAARGGLIDSNFSNGNDFKSCIILDSIFVDGVRHPYSVTSGKPNNYGLYCMSGNAREWVNDNYSKEYYQISPLENPTGPEKERLSVVRGGGWKSGTGCKKVYIRNALRGTWVDIAVGFRCANDINK